jgi:acetylornithine deacetylase/succinyl-diaminopimelate desuccinylase-like protein
MLRGGHAENALPQSATATVNCRIFPGVEVDAVQQTLQRVAGPGVQIRGLGEPLPSPASPVRSDVLDAIEAGVETIRPGTPVLPYMAPYGTDGLHLRRAGIPTYGVMGAFIKDSDQFAHGLNERVPVRSFFEGLEFLHTVIGRLAGRPTT